MAHDLEFTGERFMPGVPGEIEIEHVHRYAIARNLVAGKRVLDAACGEGYGSALLAQQAASVTGVDIDAATLAHATSRYAQRRNLAFREASAAALPFADASFDAIVSFETIEHLPAADQPRMLAEFARVLAPGGVLLLSAPNRVEYSDRRGYANPFHLHEHDRTELDALLAVHFAARRFHHQRVWLGSVLWGEDGGTTFAALQGDSEHVESAGPPPAMYYLVVAARAAADLPSAVPGLSLFGDRDGAELQRLAAQGGELVRLDALLGERTMALDRASAHVVHLEGLVARREQLIVERDAQLAAARADAAMRQTNDARALAEASADNQRLQAAIAAQERIIDYRQSARWWVTLPWLRVRKLWHRVD